MLRSVAVAIVLVGCTAPNPRVCRDGACPDPEFPFCDADGSFSGNRNACIAVTCTPMEFAACREDDALFCNADGSTYEVTECPLGCSETIAGCNRCSPRALSCVGDSLSTCGDDGTIASSEACLLGCVDGPNPHCARIVPRYLPDICDVPASAVVLIENSSTFDTGLDTNCSGGVFPQTAAPSICVARYSEFTIAAGVTLTAVGGTNEVGGGGRALAIVTDHALTIAGVIDAGGTGLLSGPGGGTVQTGGAITPTTGQGGAGFKTAGAPGGSTTANGGAMNGGAAATNPALLNALVGGHRASGGGGGAVMLISCQANVSVTGVIDASGGGGWALISSGGGGGAGGNVVLQGLQIEVTGEVFANGGGGAAGIAPGQTTQGAPGEDGLRETTYSARGGIAQPGGGEGGPGGRALAVPIGGFAPTAGGGRPGGGGGSVGFFQSYTPESSIPVLTPTRASPPFEPNGTIQTR
jgi:hypothetical protein